jgi:SAM-dependent methyltransferase
MALRAEGIACSLHDGLVEGIARYAVELGATEVGGPLSEQEAELVSKALRLPQPSEKHLKSIRSLIVQNRDPLGQAICSVRSSEERRGLGMVYTPPEIVGPMVRWVLEQRPVRVVDAGCGSGRFTTSVCLMNPDVQVIAVDVDPLATLVCRANAAVIGARKVRVLQDDYTKLDLPTASGRTAFVGNPPYVRHHMIPCSAKARACQIAESLHLSMSQLAGLHVHFYLSTARYSRLGDVGCFVTSAEWLDVGYGEVLRRLLTERFAVEALHLIDPTSRPFTDAMTTALITSFRVGAASPLVRLRVVTEASELKELDQTTLAVPRSELARTSRWRAVIEEASTTRQLQASPAGLRASSIRCLRDDMVPLGSLLRVRRGVATGCNSFFVMTQTEACERGLTSFSRQAVTSAKEIFNSGGVIRAGKQRKVLIDLPACLDSRHPGIARIMAYVAEGEREAVHRRYLCAHRNPWWALRIPEAPPVLATYMARQAPVFALNPDGLVPLNIAHGLYPRIALEDDELAALVYYLNWARGSFRGEGRTYHGGLEKFEPREMEALLIPPLPELLRIVEQAQCAVNKEA